MSKLVELIRESKSAKKEEMVPTTLRLPVKLNSYVEGLADQLSLSKQEMLLRLVEEGVNAAENELKLDDREEERKKQAAEREMQGKCSFHVLNTNKRHSVEDHEWMIREGVAAAFYDPWKYNIDRLKKGDVVFLYENGVGIVAYGTATGEVLVADHDDDRDETHYQKLQDFKRLSSKPLPAAEIKKTLSRNVVFLRTMSAMPDGQKVLDKLATYERT
ncbi:hypothetical protein [Cystobacter ferrugineus]|uniref:EVE domain-containing protein n=1 Tax=Cystobacter ferrugineus TaxID=83449 RepID=A0A1L9BA41_9BACT|nr:hypothetical protein [Cystobacter ferrugineus]OJH39136.1 hypothetical protein BON30_16460 [Cystobacter ferrugineus]